jgi:hypothetical protein
MGVEPARGTEALAGRVGPGVFTDLETTDRIDNWPWMVASDLRAARATAARAAPESSAPRAAAAAGMADAAAPRQQVDAGRYMPCVASSPRGWKKPASMLGWIERSEGSSDLVSAVEGDYGGRRSGSRRRQFPHRHGRDRESLS